MKNPIEYGAMVFQSIPLTLVLIGLFSAALIGTVISQVRLKRKLRSFMAGKDAGSLEGSVANITERNAQLERTLSAHKEALENLDRRLSGSIRGLSLVRYNAYQDMGGVQSFAAGFLDESGNGFILSVVTNRSHVGVYAKEVLGYEAQVELTAEESEALNKAKENQTV